MSDHHSPATRSVSAAPEPTGAPERDPLLDHEYDGIREFDNPLPGWWVWIFWITILFCIPYIMWYHIGLGPSIHDRYERELAAYAEQLMATYGDLEPDDATIRRFMDDSVAMTGMASLFRSRCAQCHLSDGSGSVGSNLTDAHWLHVRTLPDIYSVIAKGVPDRGMPGWEETLSPTQLVLLSSYVAQLGRNPKPGRPPEGAIRSPWPPLPPDDDAGAEPAPEDHPLPDTSVHE